MNTKGEGFSFNSIEDFDSHIELSIPNYIQLRNTITSLSSYFCKGGTVYDLGCSTGILLSKLSEVYDCKYVGIDNSENLIGKHSSKKENISFQLDDIFGYQFEQSDLILSVFTLQFIERYKRLSILKNVYKSLNDGGAFIVAEKVTLPTGLLQEIFTFTHYDYKVKSFTPDEIIGKQYALRKIMMPNSEYSNIKLFKEAGFKTIEPFWQCLSFKAWICIK